MRFGKLQHVYIHKIHKLFRYHSDHIYLSPSHALHFPINKGQDGERNDADRVISMGLSQRSCLHLNSMEILSNSVKMFVFK